jgi:hypothetical protein
MSRKHRNKKPDPAAKSATAVAAPARPDAVNVPGTAARLKQAEQTWLEQTWKRVSRPLGSLQMAVVLLASFVVVLAVGTVLESRYNGQIAQELVYRAWWFSLLLLLLGVNIFFAAAKKWPWKKHQTGFLITHLGLLTMLAGGVWTSLSGTDAIVRLIDSSNQQVKSEHGLPDSSRKMYLLGEHQITVRRLARDNTERSAKTYDFRPGSFQWHSDEILEANVHPLVSFLDLLADPFPRHWSQTVADGVKLSVVNFYPHARREPFSPTRELDGFAAAKVQIASPMGMRETFWVAMSAEKDDKRQWPFKIVGPTQTEIVGKCPTELLNEFLKPPQPEALAPKGQLVVHVNGEVLRINVGANLGRLVALGNSGHSIRITSYEPHFAAQDSGEGEAAKASDPGIAFEYTDANGTTANYLATSRFMSRGGPVTKRGEAAPRGGLKWWYHPPDFRYGRTSDKGLLQLALTDDGRLYYRSFHHEAGAFRLESSGPIPTEKLESGMQREPIPVWKGMRFQFQVLEFLPSATASPRYVPENRRPGLQRADLSPTIRCTLDGKSGEQELWIPQGGTRTLRYGEDFFRISYDIKQEDMGFEVKLLRAEQQVDAGSQSAATYTSFVQITDDGDPGSMLPTYLRPLANFVGLTHAGAKAEGEDHVITMNEPLNWRGYKLFQSQYESLTLDARERPVNSSGFTVGSDPGLFLKYLGSSMLALGIACMFYMRAYFLTGRRASPAVAATPSANGTPVTEAE